MNRIYHPHTKWEEVKYNMYGSYDEKNKDMLITKVIYFFTQRFLIRKYMEFVIENFKCSCEHNFTNPSMNKVAWLGQAAVAVWGKIPEDLTRIGWNFLDEDTQLNANQIAEEYIKGWENCQKNT